MTSEWSWRGRGHFSKDHSWTTHPAGAHIKILTRQGYEANRRPKASITVHIYTQTPSHIHTPLPKSQSTWLLSRDTHAHWSKTWSRRKITLIPHYTLRSGLGSWVSGPRTFSLSLQSSSSPSWRPCVPSTLGRNAVGPQYNAGSKRKAGGQRKAPSSCRGCRWRATPLVNHVRLDAEPPHDSKAPWLAASVFPVCSDLTQQEPAGFCISAVV